MLWIILIVIIAVVVWLIIMPEKDDEKEKQPLPPTSDVIVLGCSGSTDCGYWCPKGKMDSNGNYKIIEGVCYCKYLGKDVRSGSTCVFAERYPEKLRKGIFAELAKENVKNVK